MRQGKQYCKRPSGFKHKKIITKHRYCFDMTTTLEKPFQVNGRKYNAAATQNNAHVTVLILDVATDSVLLFNEFKGVGMAQAVALAISEYKALPRVYSI